MFIAYKYSVILKMHITMIFLLLYCFPTLTSKCQKGRFVALWFIFVNHEGQLIVAQTDTRIVFLQKKTDVFPF